MTIRKKLIERLAGLLPSGTSVEEYREYLEAKHGSEGLAEELIEGVRKIAGTGGVEDVFSDDEEP